MTLEAIKYIESKINVKPEVALILGSGLGTLADKFQDATIIDYGEIPGFPVSTVQGHGGALVFGKLAGKNVVAMKGRVHYYEGSGIDKVVYPVKVLAQLGIKKLIVTNAAGGVNKTFVPGDIMLIRDHINFTGQNPLIGKNDDDLGPRFLDMSYTYSRNMGEVARVCANEIGISLQEGVYMWFTGPTYETPAEVRLAATLGADAVGMSTVPEVIVARHRGMEVLGFSCITNFAAGVLDQPLNHEEVIEVSNMIKEKFESLITKVVGEI